MGYGKIYEELFTGSMVGKSSLTFAVWVWIIVHARAIDGTIDIHPRLLAAMFNAKESEVVEVLKYLESPDEFSSSEEEEGRRIMHVGPGITRYRVVNLTKWKLKEDDTEVQRFKWREQKHRQRANAKGIRTTPTVSTDNGGLSTDVHGCPQSQVAMSIQAQAQAQAEASTDIPIGMSVRAKKFAAPQPKEAGEYGASIGLPAREVEKFLDYFDSNGWKVGGKTVMKDWKAALRNWKRNWEERNHGTGNNRPSTGAAERNAGTVPSKVDYGALARRKSEEARKAAEARKVVGQMDLPAVSPPAPRSP